MKDFLLYDVLGGIMYYLPALVLSIFIGYLINKSLSKKESIKKYSVVISVVVVISIFSYFLFKM